MNNFGKVTIMVQEFSVYIFNRDEVQLSKYSVNSTNTELNNQYLPLMIHYTSMASKNPDQELIHLVHFNARIQCSSEHY